MHKPTFFLVPQIPWKIYKMIWTSTAATWGFMGVLFTSDDIKSLDCLDALLSKRSLFLILGRYFSACCKKRQRKMSAMGLAT